MVFMAEIIENKAVDEAAEQRLITEMKVSSETAADWKQVYEDYHTIEEKISEFNDTCWSDIKAINDRATVTGFRFVHEGIALLSMYSAGRIMINIGPEIMDGRFYVTVIGNGTIPKGKEGTYQQQEDGKYQKEKSPRCGFQGIHAKKDEALEFLDSIIKNWDRKLYREHRGAGLG